MHYVFLGLIQGLTEFLPVSSSGHLVIMQFLFNVEIPGVAFETFVHFGTSLAVIILFRNEILRILFAFFSSLAKILKLNFNDFIAHLKENDDCKYAWFLFVSTLPAAFFGYFFQNLFEQFFNSIVFTALMLIVTGICLFITEKIFINGKKNIKEIKLIDAVIVGLAQAFAIFPGISRSGFTIMAGLGRKLDRVFAAKYSLILSIPTIIGASILKIPEITCLEIDKFTLLISGIVSCITGYFAMLVLIKVLMKYKLHIFSYYLWSVGTIIIIIKLI